MKGISKRYTVEDNDEIWMCPPAPNSSPFFFFLVLFFFLILRAMGNYFWTENRRLNSNVRRELQSLIAEV